MRVGKTYCSSTSIATISTQKTKLFGWKSDLDLPSLLSPLGEHRRTHTQPSKGKKRKRDIKAPSDDSPKPPAPAIGSHVLVGLNSVTRHLENLAASTAPPTTPAKELEADDKDAFPIEDNAADQSALRVKPLSMVIITHPQPSLSPSHAHIPTLLHLATLRPHSETKSSQPTRLIALSTTNDARFARALHIPRVGAIGIYEGALGAKALEEYVRKYVGLTECSWVDEAIKPEWRGLNVVQA